MPECYLPAGAPAPVPPAAPVPSGRSGAPPRRPGVLVVDDTPGVRGVLGSAVLLGGFDVWLAADGVEGIDTYLANLGSIGLAVLDVQMPGQDGPEVLAALRGLTPGLPCCFMSGDLGRYTRADLLALGALAVFEKPLHLAEVVGLVRRALTGQELDGPAAQPREGGGSRGVGAAP